MGRLERIKVFRRSVRFRLTVWYLAVLSLILFIFSLIVYVVIVQGSKMMLDDNLRIRAAQIQASYSPATGQFDPRVVNNGDYSIGETGPEFLLFLNTRGQAAQQSNGLDVADIRQLSKIASRPRTDVEVLNDYNLLQALSVPNTNQFFSAYRVYITSVYFQGNWIGSLILGASRNEVLERNRLILVTLLIMIPITLLVSAWAGYWLATRAMKPMHTMSQTVRAITETDLSKRLNVETQDELGELATTFDQMLTRLENAFCRQQQFMSDTSHELRTPLTILNLEVDAALAGNYQVPQYQRMLPVLKDEINYMTWVINDLLTLARADTNQMVLKAEELDLSELVLEVIENFTSLAKQKQIEIKSVELPELTICGDYLYLTRMLNNLIENAIKYSEVVALPESSSQNSIELTPPSNGIGSSQTTVGKWIVVETGVAEEKWAWVRISDNGPGIASQHLPYLFDRFYRVDTSRYNNPELANAVKIKGSAGSTTSLSGGSGLGLAIVKMVAELHGGQVRVESRVGPGSGTSFEIRLPLFDLS